MFKVITFLLSIDNVYNFPTLKFFYNYKYTKLCGYNVENINYYVIYKDYNL